MFQGITPRLKHNLRQSNPRVPRDRTGNREADASGLEHMLMNLSADDMQLATTILQREATTFPEGHADNVSTTSRPPVLHSTGEDTARPIAHTLNFTPRSHGSTPVHAPPRFPPEVAHIQISEIPGILLGFTHLLRLLAAATTELANLTTVLLGLSPNTAGSSHSWLIEHADHFQGPHLQYLFYPPPQNLRWYENIDQEYTSALFVNWVCSPSLASPGANILAKELSQHIGACRAAQTTLGSAIQNFGTAFTQALPTVANHITSSSYASAGTSTLQELQDLWDRTLQAADTTTIRNHYHAIGAAILHMPATNLTTIISSVQQALKSLHTAKCLRNMFPLWGLTVYAEDIYHDYFLQQMRQNENLITKLSLYKENGVKSLHKLLTHLQSFVATVPPVAYQVVQSPVSTPSGFDPNDAVCFRCGKLDHIRATCPLSEQTCGTCQGDHDTSAHSVITNNGRHQSLMRRLAGGGRGRGQRRPRGRGRGRGRGGVPGAIPPSAPASAHANANAAVPTPAAGHAPAQPAAPVGYVPAPFGYPHPQQAYYMHPGTIPGHPAQPSFPVAPSPAPASSASVPPQPFAPVYHPGYGYAAPMGSFHVPNQ